MPISLDVQSFINKCEKDYNCQDVNVDSSGQSKKFDDKGNQLYMFPSYGWDGGNAITQETLNLKRIEYIDIFNGPAAGIYVKIDSSIEAAIFYKYENDDDGLVFIV